MDAEGVERIVIAEFVFDGGGHVEAEDAGEEADEERGHGLDEARRGGDGDESGDGSRDGAEDARLAVADPFGEHPAESGGSGGEVGGDEGAGRESGGGEGAAGVESEPADPEEAGSDTTEHDAVRLHGLAGIADPSAEIERADERGDSRRDVDDGAS